MYFSATINYLTLRQLILYAQNHRILRESILLLAIYVKDKLNTKFYSHKIPSFQKDVSAI